MENDPVKFVICFLCQVKALDDYITLHNLSMLLTYIVTFTIILYNGATIGM